jgi:hypothetical protein
MSHDKGISMCCALSDETVLWLSGVPFAAEWRMESVSLSYSFINLKRYCGIEKVLITIRKLYVRTGFENENEELALAVITPSRTAEAPEAPRRKRACTDPKSASAGAKEENQAMLLEADDKIPSSMNAFFVSVSLFSDNVEDQHKGSHCKCSIHGDLARTEEQRRSTTARGCRASMLDTDMVNKRTNLPLTNS